MPDNPSDRKDPETENENDEPRGYYYDDACGYELYVPGDEEDEDEKTSGDESAAR